MKIFRRLGKPVAALVLAGVALQASLWCCTASAMVSPSTVAGMQAGRHHQRLDSSSVHCDFQGASAATCKQPSGCPGPAAMQAVTVKASFPASFETAPSAVAPLSPVPVHVSLSAGRVLLSRYVRPVYSSPPCYLRNCAFLE